MKAPNKMVATAARIPYPVRGAVRSGDFLPGPLGRRHNNAKSNTTSTTPDARQYTQVPPTSTTDKNVKYAENPTPPETSTNAATHRFCVSPRPARTPTAMHRRPPQRAVGTQRRIE